MFKVKIDKILPLFPDRSYIEYSTENLKLLGVPLPTLIFNIQRSETPHIDATWETVAEESGSDFYYIDQLTRLLTFYSTIYYRIWVNYGGINYYSNVTTVMRNLRRDEFLRRRKMLYDEELVLRKFSGVKVAILKRRHFGERCTDCYDPNTGSVTKSHCDLCLGTGFLMPYHEPFVTYSARVPVVKQVEETNPDSASELDYTRYQLLDYPTVSPQDIVVDTMSNDRYKVDKVDQTEIRREVVHQEMTVTKLAPSSAEYKIQLPSDIMYTKTNIEF